MAKRERILLMNGCSISKPSVNPPNWESGGTSLLQRDWYIQYYYHDPANKKRWPKGKLCIVKGMNDFKTLTDRRKSTKDILKGEIDELLNGWNPIRKSFMFDESIKTGSLHPDLFFIDAFYVAVQRIKVTDRHRNEVKLVVQRLEKSARKLKMRNITIDNLKRRELKQVLQGVGFKPAYYNKAKAYISSLFIELIEDECCDVNLARDIRNEKVTKKKRKVMTVEELHAVMNYLHKSNYNFWRYAQIFMFSGSRSTEMLLLKYKDVDLDNQEFKVTINKGGESREEIKVILPNVLKLWREVCFGCKPEDYIFSNGLAPGPDKIRDDQVGKRWRRNVKLSNNIRDVNGRILKITADFYTLKHIMLDSLPDEQAQALASHKSVTTTAIYQINKEKREREKLKQLRIVV